MRYILPAVALATLAIATAGAVGAVAATQMGSPSPQLKAAVAHSGRTPANVARDKYRNPAATLAFFGVQPDHTVVELWPGGGWYTEILAPYLAERGTLYGAVPARALDAIKQGIASRPGLARMKPAVFPALSPDDMKVPDNSADVVLTFRNAHNWRMGYQHPDRTDYSAAAFQQIFAMLKPGGILGVVDHRLPETADAAREQNSGYIKVSTIKKLAADAGFELAGESEINANPKDTADWKDGVWTLPPSLRLRDVDRAKYEAIGESDRMTLKFRKPG